MISQTFGTIKDKVFYPAVDLAKSASEDVKGNFSRVRQDIPVEDLDGSGYAKYDDMDGEAVPQRTFRPTDPCGPCCDWCEVRCFCCKWPKRYIMALMSGLGFLISFGIRCNLGVAIVQMTANRTTDINGLQVDSAPEFEWTPETIGIVDSSFFWGYIITQVPGGFLANRFAANKMFGGAIAISAFLNMLVPSAAKAHFTLVMVVRVLQGLVEGVTYPSCHGIWRYWAPPLERSKLATISFCGSYAGAVVSLPLSGLLVDKFGWQSCFYVYGAMGLTWFVGWVAISFESPAVHPRISDEERLYIESSIGEPPKQPQRFKDYPWACFFSSTPVWAIIVANFCRSWTFYLLIVSQPLYFDQSFHFDPTKSGFLSALPHLLMSVIVPIGGQIADTLRSKGILSTTNVRKVFNCGGFFMEAVFLLGVGYTRDQTAAIVCLTLAVGFSGFAISGFNVNHLDIAPRYASILMGLSNGAGTLSGMICPIVVQAITKTKLASDWEKVFLIASLIHFTGVAFYAIFASGDLQWWADPQYVDENNPATGWASNKPSEKLNPAPMYGITPQYERPQTGHMGAVIVQQPPASDLYDQQQPLAPDSYAGGYGDGRAHNRHEPTMEELAQQGEYYLYQQADGNAGQPTGVYDDSYGYNEPYSSSNYYGHGR